MGVPLIEFGVDPVTAIFQPQVAQALVVISGDFRGDGFVADGLGVQVADMAVGDQLVVAGIFIARGVG